ncbi:MAG: type II secretory pathway, component PulD [Planctomycetota bacterium]
MKSSPPPRARPSGWLLTALFLTALAANQTTAQTSRGMSDLYPGEAHRLHRIEFRDARVVDAIRLISEISGLNVASTAEAGEKQVTLLLQNVEAGQAVETLCKVSGLWYRRDDATRTFRIMSTSQFQQDLVVYRQSETHVFTLQHPNAVAVAMSIRDLYGERVQLSLGIGNDELDQMDGAASSALGGGAGAQGGYSRGGFDYQAGRFARSTASYNQGGYRGGSSYSGGGMRSGNGRRQGDRDSENLLDEELTADQLSLLQDRSEGGEIASVSDLAGISRHDPTIYITVNRQHNLIVVRTADSDAMDEIAHLMVELDRPTPQVLLEMKILELSLGDTFHSVFDYEILGGTETAGPPDSQPANPLLPGAATSPKNVLGIGNYPLEGGTLVYQFLSDKIRARIQLLAGDNRLDILATPIVLASNNRPARMFVGEERVLTTGVNVDVVTPDNGPTTAFVEPITEVRDVGNTLIVVPKINADRTVTLFISQDSSSVQSNGATIPVANAGGGISQFSIDTVNTATLQATVVAKDGMTLAIGGLIRESLLESVDKTPLLGDIPFIGFLFRREVWERRRTELVLLIKPRVLFTPTEAEEATEQRLEALSRHPWKTERDNTYRKDFDEVEDQLKEYKEEKK